MSKRTEATSGDSLHPNCSEQDGRDKTGSLSGAPQPASMSAHPVDRGWSWAVMMGVYGIHFLTFGYIRSFGILFVEFQTKFQATSAITAVVNGAQFCTYSLSTFVVMNVLTKHISFRQCCLLGCVLESLGILLNGIVTDIKYLIVTQGLLFGSGLACLYCPALIILSHYFDKKRAIATSIAISGVSAGGMTLPPLMRYLLDTYGLAGGLLLLAGILFHQAVCASLFTPTSKYIFVSADERISPKIDRGNQNVDSKINGQDITAECQPLISSEGTVTLGKVTRVQAVQQLPSGYVLPSREVRESPLLLEQVSESLHMPDELREQTRSLDKETYKQEKYETFAEDQEDKDVPNSITTSLLTCQSPESALEQSSSQAITSSEDSHRLKSKSHLQQTSSAESANSHGKDTSPSSQRYVPDDSLTFVQNPPRKPSLKATTILEALSTSSLDLRCNMHGLTHQGQSESDQRNDNGLEVKELSEKRRRRCRLPAVVKTLYFWVVLVFFACGWVSSALPTIFIPPLAKEKGFNDQAAILLMASALAELVGRLGPGIILQFGFLQPHSILIVPLAACATLYQFTGLFNDLATLLTLAVLSGLFTGVFWAMQSLVVIEVFGLDKLGEMLGMYFLVSGLCVGAANPLSGLLRDVYGTYGATFHFFGVMYYVAAGTMIAIVFIRRAKSKRLEVTSSSEKHQTVASECLEVTSSREEHQNEPHEHINKNDSPHVISVADDMYHSTSVIDDTSHVTSVSDDKWQTNNGVRDNSQPRIIINR